MKRLKKPPLGIKPQFLVDEERITLLKEAIQRYMDANYPVPQEFIEEYNEKVGRLKEQD